MDALAVRLYTSPPPKHTRDLHVLERAMARIHKGPPQNAETPTVTSFVIIS